MKKLLSFPFFILFILCSSLQVNAASRKPLSISDENANPQLFCDETLDSHTKADIEMTEASSETEDESDPIAQEIQFIYLSTNQFCININNYTGYMMIFPKNNSRLVTQIGCNTLKNVSKVWIYERDDSNFYIIVDCNGQKAHKCHIISVFKFDGLKIEYLFTNKSILKSTHLVNPFIYNGRTLSFELYSNPSVRYQIYFNNPKNHQILSVDCGNVSIEFSGYDTIQNSFFYQPR